MGDMCCRSDTLSTPNLHQIEKQKIKIIMITPILWLMDFVAYSLKPNLASDKSDTVTNF